MTANPIVIEPYPHDVEIKRNGATLAESRRAQLLIETYAPDIYIPFPDIDMERMRRTGKRTTCPHKGLASYWRIDLGDDVAEDAMWAYEEPIESAAALSGHAAFYFDEVETYVDGRLVRGHVRDPHHMFTVEPLGVHLAMALAGEVVVDSNAALVLKESGLPDRFYVPEADVAAACLGPSTRQSVCTYKGEATYHHMVVGGTTAENALWSYPDPWTDFSEHIGRIKGHLGFYTSTFDRVVVDGVPVDIDEAARSTDTRMQAKPTIDSTLAAKLG